MSGSLTHVDRPDGAVVLDRGVLPTTEVVARVHRIQEVMKSLMKVDVHFGTIPGTPKPTLYKPGAELLLMTFRIATSSQIEDLSTPDEIRYRVTVRGTNQVSGEVVGEMAGECSSNEEKYRWRKPVCDEEFDETPPDRRREKWAKGRDGAYKVKQVRTSPSDVANTILKMATKRGLVAMTLVTLAASDIFAQDLEDLTEEMRESIAGEDKPKAETKAPQRKSQSGNPAAAAKQLLADAKFVVGVVEKVDEPTGKKFSTIRIKGDARSFNAWNDSGAAVIRDAKAFAGTDHQVKLAYTEASKDGKTFYNPVGIAIADAEPAAVAATENTTTTGAGAVTASAAAPAAADLLAAANPFINREPGAEG
jgi:hypothetical protein